MPTDGRRPALSRLAELASASGVKALAVAKFQSLTPNSLQVAKYHRLKLDVL